MIPKGKGLPKFADDSTLNRIRGKAMELVKCPITGLPVPANAEIVIDTTLVSPEEAADLIIARLIP